MPYIPSPLTNGSPRRIKIYFEDDAVRQRSQAIVQELLKAVQETPTVNDCNSTLLAKKALKYRRVYDRLAGVDVRSPDFDACKFMGVEWCHTPCLKTHCASLS